MMKVLRRIPNKRMRARLLTWIYCHLNWKPDELMLDISSKCNSACPFCFRTQLDIQGKFMDARVFYDAVNEAYRLGIRQCRLYTTGEPLLHPQVDDFIRYLKEKNFSVMVSTNGQFLDLHMEAMSLIDEVKISVEGWDKESYEYYRRNCSFERLLSNLWLFKKYLTGRTRKPVVTIGLMVMRETNMEQFYRAWRDKCDQISIWPTVYAFDWDENKKIKYFDFCNDQRLKKNMYDFIDDPKKPRYCGYPFRTVLVSAEGNVVICCNDFSNRIVYGNVKKNRLSEILRSPLRKAVQRQFLTGQLNVCNGCNAFKRMTDKSEEQYKNKINK